MDGTTTQALNDLIKRLKDGDQSAGWEILERARERLCGLASRILNNDFAKVRRMVAWSTSDVAGEAQIRLAKALEDVKLNDSRHFFCLGAQKIRWLLLDEVRRLPKNLDRDVAVSPPDGRDRRDADQGGVIAKMLELLAELPEEEYAVLDAQFVLGLNDLETAEALDIDDRKVRRHRMRAYDTLAEKLRTAFPELGKGPASGQQ